MHRRPLTVVSLEPKNDLANTLFGRRTQGRFPLHVRRGFRIEPRTVFVKSGPAPALIIDAITHADLGDATCADLVADDFDLRGLYVQSLDPADAKHGRPTTVGQVLRVDGASLPRYIVGDNKTADSTRGLFKSGPVHVPSTVRNGVRACVICERARHRDVEAFLAALRDGEGSHRALTQTWKIGAMAFTIFDAASSSAADYEKAFQAAIDEGSKWQLALVEVPSDTQDAHGDQNPYLVTKAKFLARNVPVQEFRVETMKKPISQRQWALGGIGLQVFAKLGGVPWLLKTNTKVHELILGLGSASLGTSRFGARDRVVGLTTAFSGDGRYYLTETSRTVKFEEHEAAVIESAVSAFKRVRAEMAWRAGDTVRVVLHSFKDLKRTHIDALKSAVLAVAGTELKVEFAFLHLAEQHPILLFDPSEQQQIPSRGAVVHMGRYEALVAVLGPNDNRNDRVGFPRPIYIKLQQGSTFTDLDYLSEQALAFAALSWRNFTPTSEPITVLYAELIANLLGRLGSLSRWDPDVLRGDVGTSRWFL